MLASGRLYANFYTRLPPECDDRRRRLEKALDLKSSSLVELALNELEDRLVRSLNDAQREEYFRGELDRELIRTINLIDPPRRPAAAIGNLAKRIRPPIARKREASTA